MPTALSHAPGGDGRSRQITGMRVKLLQSVDLLWGKKETARSQIQARRWADFVIFEMLSVFWCVFVRQNERERKEAYSTWYSQAVSHPSTDRALGCLTSVIGREPVYSTWYGRRH